MKISQRKNRGSILILASLFTFLTLLLAFTLFKVLPVEYNAAQKSRVDIGGHYALDAGVKDAISWIESRPQGTVFTQALLDGFNTTFGQQEQLVENWTYTTNIQLLGLGHFGITSEAFYREDKVREVKVQIVREGFAHYALFIDNWRDEERPDDVMIYGLGSNTVTGPFHTNDFFVLSHKTGDFFEDGGEPFVSGPYAQMTHARTTEEQGEDVPGEGDGNAYLESGATAFNRLPEAVPFDENGSVEQRYQRIVEGGRGNLTQVSDIYFPDTAQDRDGNDLREKSRGDEPFSGQLDRGVYVASDEAGDVKGGVYVVGDSKVTLQLDANGNQVQKIEQEHIEIAYFEVVEEQVERPNYVLQQTTEPPEFVNEVEMVDQVRTFISHYETTVVAGDGVTTTVQSPVYDQEIVQVPQIVSVPYDPDVHGTGPWTIYVEDPDNPIIYITNHLTPLSEEEYDQDNPLHQSVPQPAGDRTYEVVEVTVDAGYQVPPGFTIEGGSASVPKDSTVFLDYEEGLARVFSGNLNGVTFVDGNIESFKGTVKGAVTDGPNGRTFSGRSVVAAPEQGLKVQITGDILQYFDGGGENQGPNRTLKPGVLPSNADHALGLIGNNVELKLDYQTGQTNPLNLYAVILAGHGKYNTAGEPLLNSQGRHLVTGGFGTFRPHLESGSPLAVGRFRLYGGLIEGNAKAWFLAYGGGTKKGFEGDLIYDPAAAAGLQNFPATNNTRVIRYSEYADYD
ncbi:MAG: hypothetical protein WC423_25200 [Vulcanimicrobiota bacterium]